MADNLIVQLQKAKAEWELGHSIFVRIANCICGEVIQTPRADIPMAWVKELFKERVPAKDRAKEGEYKYPDENALREISKCECFTKEQLATMLENAFTFNDGIKMTCKSFLRQWRHLALHFDDLPEVEENSIWKLGDFDIRTDGNIAHDVERICGSLKCNESKPDFLKENLIVPMGNHASHWDKQFSLLKHRNIPAEYRAGGVATGEPLRTRFIREVFGLHKSTVTRNLDDAISDPKHKKAKLYSWKCLVDYCKKKGKNASELLEMWQRSPNKRCS